MVFTVAQKTLAYELLGLFEGGTFDWFDYSDRITGVITSVPIANQIDFTTSTTRLEAIFTAIEAAADNREVRIGEILTQYSALSLDVFEVKRGGTAGVSGARFSTKRNIDHLRTLLQTHLGIRISVSGPAQGSMTGTFTRNADVYR